jgi:hypothetical protein
MEISARNEKALTGLVDYVFLQQYRWIRPPSPAEVAQKKANIREKLLTAMQPFLEVDDLCDETDPFIIADKLIRAEPRTPLTAALPRVAEVAKATKALHEALMAKGHGEAEQAADWFVSIMLNVSQAPQADARIRELLAFVQSAPADNFGPCLQEYLRGP